MNVETSIHHARRVLFVFLSLGILILILGIVCLAISLQHTAVHVGGWQAFDQAAPSLAIMLFGLLITITVGFIEPLLAVHLQQNAAEHWRYEQIRGAMESQRQQLEAIRESVSLSDAAKQVAYRHKDREALRHAIREDIDKNDYEAAYWLTSEMERRFGSKQEAMQLRDMIETARRKFIETEVREALVHFDQLLKRYDWTSCYREMDQLIRMFSSHPDIQRLPERLQAARDAHKRSLLREWKDSVSKDDVDRSVELLKQLDQYLTPGEAEGYKEIARDVFKKKLQQLGVQFALHVNDKNWPEALRIGQQIITEFPNARIASEVRDRMPIIKEKVQPTQPSLAV